MGIINFRNSNNKQTHMIIRLEFKEHIYSKAYKIQDIYCTFRHINRPIGVNELKINTIPLIYKC